MAAITPSTELYLLKTPLEDDGRNTLTFKDAAAQHDWFNSLPKLNPRGLSSESPDPDFSYQRKDGIIRFPGCVDDLYGYNYVMYKNKNYGDKWFYAFITNMEFANSETTFISIKTDVFQTWQFALKYKPSFIEREHTNDDTPGSNTVPEGLELGEPVMDEASVSMNFGIGSGKDIYVACFQVTETLTDHADGVTSLDAFIGDSDRNFNGISSGTYFFGVLPGQIKDVIRAYNFAGKSDAIVSIFYAPVKAVAGGSHTCSFKTGDNEYKSVIVMSPDSSDDATTYDDLVLTGSNTLAGYAPKNKKLFTYPYCYIVGTNNGGASYEYHYEDFADINNIHFSVRSALCQGMSTKLYPLNYKGFGTDLKSLADYSITGAKFPTLSWLNDIYLNWIAQEGGVLNAGIFTDIASAGTSLALNAALNNQPTGTITGGISSALNIGASILGTMAEVDKQKRLPDQARGNAAAGDINWSTKTFGFTLRRMCIRNEYARRIDSFFSMFGYKTNQVKYPNVTGRKNWNYVKSIGLNIEGDVPQADMDEIRSMFDSGLTLWHNPAHYLDYSQDNSII